MSTPAGNALHLVKRLEKAVTALEAVARHPAATAADRAAVRNAKYALYPLFVRLSLAITGKRICAAFVRLAEWCRVQASSKGASHE